MKRILTIAGMLSIALTLILATPAFADTANPDSAPTIEAKYVYRNLAETGDMLYIWEANIPYAALPATRGSDSFLWRLVALDGVTELGSATGYSYDDDGYGYNVYSIYFPAATVAALGLVWDTAYILKLNGNPAVFTTPPEYNYAFAASDYTSSTTQADNQEELADTILELAFDLNNRWSLTGDDILTLEMETTTVLSLIGEDFFRGAIRGIQILAPAAFRYIVEDLNAPDRAWNDSYVSSLENQYAGTWVEAARNASRDFLGTSYDLFSIILLLIACVVLIFCNIALTGDHWSALIDALFILVIAARLGVYGLAYLGLLGAIAILYIGTKIWRMIPT